MLACWREARLAQKVLKGETRGYRYHPQLTRFRSQTDPLAAIGSYLTALADEADRRGCRFDRSKINPKRQTGKLPVNRGQLSYEWGHLKEKIHCRDPERFRQSASIELPDSHPSFEVVEGGIEAWEKR